ncbi:MAG: sigma-E factor negative regulatory protein [Granulosicoccus sp.]
MNPTDKSNDQKLSQLMDGEWQDLNPSDCVAALCADDALHAKWARYHIIRDVLKNEPVKANPALSASICQAIQDEPTYSNITAFTGVASADKSSSPVTEPAIDQPTSSGLRAAAASSVATANGQPQGNPSWVNTGVAGFAVAASVALVTVVGLNLTQDQQQDRSSVLTQTFVAAEDAGVTTVATAPSVVNAGSIAVSPPPPRTGVNTYVEVNQTGLPEVEFVANTGSFWMSPESFTRVSDEKRLNMMLSHHIENSPTAGREGLLPYSRLIGYEESN